MLKKYVLYICVITSIVFAQDVTVQGTVKDAETNEPLLGASIILKGTLLGTTTNNEGHFEISVPAENATLMFTYIGYKTSEVPVSSSSGMLNIMLESDVLNQEEVIVVGLASTVKRRNLANAVATVSAEELIPTPTQTLDDALSGKFSGVSIRRNTGAPGGGINVNLRGTSTLQGETQPIYIIDGVIINNFANQSGIDVVSEATGAGSATPQGQPSNRIGDINPNDIESMEILKGASAAALYGAKASNGVIIITTKKRQRWKDKI